jgi:hypothetical protein
MEFIFKNLDLAAKLRFVEHYLNKNTRTTDRVL